MKIGIIGFGYVGSAVAASYSDDNIMVNDPQYPQQSVDLSEIKKKCSAIFICVPTPSDKQGQCDVSILQDVIKSLRGFTGVVISKSTAPPQVYTQLEKSSKLKLAHVPEFLTQARAKVDYVNPHKILVGCEKKIRGRVTEVILGSDVNFDRVKIEYCSIAEASFFKYMANNMLAMKVMMCNELHALSQEMGLDWHTITNIARTDDRLGNTHWAVPGPDGLKGFGGACFPKDTRALQHLGQTYSVAQPVLDCVIATNAKYRD